MFRLLQAGFLALKPTGGKLLVFQSVLLSYFVQSCHLLVLVLFLPEKLRGERMFLLVIRYISLLSCYHSSCYEARFAVPVHTGVSKFSRYGTGGLRTGKPSDRYVPLVSGGTWQYGKPCYEESDAEG
ncbi:hypothetical protein BHM03_00020560 [Ensete ventricosum]|nr:hypothetical protein BHM03_00020560 [Ensete ventricosum]